MKNKFRVKIEKGYTTSYLWVYRGEQHAIIPINKPEAEQIIKALAKYFKIDLTKMQ